MKKLLLLSLCLSWSALCFSQKWLTITGNDSTTWGVDLSSIERVDNLIYCWEQLTPVDEDARLEQAREFYDIWKDKKWLKYGYTLVYYVYDCSGKKSQTLSSIYYDTQGKSLHSNDNPELSINYKRLIPGTVGMSVFDELNEKHIFEVEGVEYAVYMEDVFLFLFKNPNAKYLGDTWWIEYAISIKDEPDENDIEDKLLDTLSTESNE